MSLRDQISRIVGEARQEKADADDRNAAAAADAFLKLLSDESLLRIASTWVPRFGSTVVIKILGGKAKIFRPRGSQGDDLDIAFPDVFPSRAVEFPAVVARVDHLVQREGFFQITFDDLSGYGAMVVVTMPGA